MRVGLALALVAATLAVVPGTACAEEHVVKVVIVTDDGNTVTRCAEIEETSSGIEALQALDLDVSTKDFGGDLGSAVCAIGDTGNPLARCPGADAHWHYWRVVEGDWVESERGPTFTQVSPGDVEGWVWTTGPSNRPPSVAPDEAECQAAAPQPERPTGSVIGWALAFVVIASVFLIGLRRPR